MKKDVINSLLKRILLIVVTFFILFASEVAVAQTKKATWIWYPGDYDIWLGNQMQNRRTECGTFFPSWKLQLIF